MERRVNLSPTARTQLYRFPVEKYLLAKAALKGLLTTQRAQLEADRIETLGADIYRSSTIRGSSWTLITILFSISELDGVEIIGVDDIAWAERLPGPH
jgi:hypothetical protein